MRDRFVGPLLAGTLCAGLALALSTALATAAEIRVVTVGALQNALNDAAVLAGAANKDAAAAFLKYVTGKPAAATWKAANIDAM